EFNFHVKDIGDVHEKSSIFKDDGYKSIYQPHGTPAIKPSGTRILRIICVPDCVLFLCIVCATFFCAVFGWGGSLRIRMRRVLRNMKPRAGKTYRPVSTVLRSDILRNDFPLFAQMNFLISRV
ncbi:hypothetical protein ACQSED_13695, partial [Salmonella enterica]|uniref:hypothetical protein n=1 Tax=Salmonella enterica TaxID=28901 RepID=UPI003D32449C